MAGPSLCSQRGLPLLSPRIEESRWTHLPARRPLPLNLILRLFTGRTSLGYSFLLFFSFSRCWGSSFGFFSADSWVRAAVAGDGGWAGRATAGARGAGVGAGGGWGGGGGLGGGGGGGGGFGGFGGGSFGGGGASGSW